jgi:hypothetical protein
MVSCGFRNGSDNPSLTGEPAWNADVPPLTGPGRPYDLDESYPDGPRHYAGRDQDDVGAED